MSKGELEHCHVKCFYSRTNKINFAHAIAKHQQRQRLLHRIEEEHHMAGEAAGWTKSGGGSVPMDDEMLPDCPPEAHYQIGNSKKLYWNLDEWLAQNKNDQALQVRTNYTI